MSCRAALLVLLAVRAGSAAAACPERDAYRALELGHAVETLTPDSPDWTDTELRYRDVLAPGKALHGRVTRSSRFDLDDTTVAAGAYWPLGAADTLVVEAGYSPSHRVLARSSAQAAWARQWGGGWGTQLGVRHLGYAATDVTIGELTLERYLGAFRFAYTYNPSRSSAAGTAAGHRVQGGYYYGGFSTVQLVLAAGDEVDKPSAAAAVVPVEVRGAALFGLQQIGCDWGVGWSLGYTENRGGADGERSAAGLYLHRRF
jgi:YaiO family outer membrane protein